MTRDDIIGAAFKVWGRELYKVTSLSKLADTLGVSKPALYRHFPDKQALLDAMERRFFDDYAANIKPAIEKVRELESWQERILIMVRGMTEFFSFNFDYFIFSLDKMSQKDHFHHYTDELEKRGIRFSEFAPKDAPLLRLFGERCTVSAGEIPEIFFADPIGGGNPANFFVDYPSVLFFAGITAIFETGRYHKQRSLQVLHKVQDPSGISGAGDPLGVAAAAVEKVRKGLGFNREIVEALPFEALEKPGIEAPLPPNSLFLAVAEAVALAGPWNASMEMVAKLSGLSKSGLYAHFKSKEDMLSKLFVPEFKRIAELAVKYAGLSERREERLYLVLFSIAEYLRMRPDILIVLDWVRIQRLELDFSAPPGLYKFSEDLKFVFAPGENPQENFKWILFLLIAVLMHMRQDRKREPSNESIRTIYRFIALGIEGLHDDVPKI